MQLIGDSRGFFPEFRTNIKIDEILNSSQLISEDNSIKITYNSQNSIVVIYNKIMNHYNLYLTNH